MRNKIKSVLTKFLVISLIFIFLISSWACAPGILKVNIQKNEYNSVDEFINSIKSRDISFDAEAMTRTLEPV